MGREVGADVYMDVVLFRTGTNDQTQERAGVLNRIFIPSETSYQQIKFGEF